jgi:hypothetical protein
MNPCLSTNALTTEGILYWSYGISNRSTIRGIDHYPETWGRIELRMDDLRVEAAMVQKAVNDELKFPHLRGIIEAKYGERTEAVEVCAVLLKKTARTQTHSAFCRVVLDFCEFRSYRDKEAMADFGMGRNATREGRSRYLGILEGWHRLAVEAVEEVFRERGWVER